ncbi:MAG: hypothetical protein PHR53_00370 [Bacteroidales bacterium]|nr:hypothetical protein [Bacteroidales bacterium]
MKNLTILIKSVLIAIAIVIIGCEPFDFNPFQSDPNNQFTIVNAAGDTSKCNIGFGIAISRPLNDSLLLSYVGDPTISQVLSNINEDSMMATVIVLSTLEFDENTDLMTIILLDQDDINSGTHHCLPFEQTMLPNFVLPDNSFLGYVKVNANSIIMHNATVVISEEEGSYEIDIEDGSALTGEHFSCHFKGLLPRISN